MAMEEGQYHGKLLRVEAGQLGNVQQTPFIEARWTITHRAVDGEWQELPEAEERGSRWWATPKAEPYTMDRLEALGFNGDFEHQEFDADPNPVSEGVTLVCKHNEQGYEEWDLARQGGRKAIPWDTDALLRFKAKYQSRRTMHPTAPARPQEAQQEPDASLEIGENETPF